MSGLRITDAKEISRLISKGLIKDHTTAEKYLKATKKIQKQDVGFCMIPPKERPSGSDLRGQIPKRCVEDSILAIQTNAVWLPFAGAVCKGQKACYQLCGRK